MDNNNKEYESFCKQLQNCYIDLPDNEKKVLFACMVLCPKGWIKLRSLAEIVNPNDRKMFQQILVGLDQKGWIKKQGNEIKTSSLYASVLYHIDRLDTYTLNAMLYQLKDRTFVTIYSDLLKKKTYFIMAFSIMTYIFEQNIACDPIAFANLTANIGVYHGFLTRDLDIEEPPSPIYNVYDLPVFKLLLFAKTLLPQASIELVRVYTQIGVMYSAPFMYKEAEAHLSIALSWANNHNNGINPEKVEVLKSLAAMYQYKGQSALALNCLSDAYKLNKALNNSDGNIEICYMIAEICNVIDAKESLNIWLNRARKLVGKRELPQMCYANILKLKSEAVLVCQHMTDVKLCLGMLDEAKAIASAIFGVTSPLVGDIECIREGLCGRNGLFREANIAYWNYIRCNNRSFGKTTNGDAVIQMTSDISNELFYGNEEAAIIKAKELNEKFSDESFYASHVRIERLGELAYVCSYNTHEYDYSDECADKAIQLLKEELPTDAFLKGQTVLCQDEIMNLKYNEQYLSFLYRIKINSALAQNDIARAESLYKDAKSTLSQRERNLLEVEWITLRYSYDEEKEEHWNQIFSSCSQKDLSALASSIAHEAFSCEMFSVAQNYLEKYVDLSGLSYNSWKNLLFNAKILGEIGLEELAAERFNDAVDLAISDSQKSVVYYQWSFYCTEERAIELLQEAIRLWSPPCDDLYDEKLAWMMYQLALNFDMAGNSAEAAKTLERAIAWHPTEFPADMLEDFE